MAERQFDFDFTDDSIGTVRILAVPVAGGGGGQTIEVNVDGTNYPIKSIRKISVSGVQGWMYTLDDGSLDGISFFFADGVGLNYVKNQILASIPEDIVSAGVIDEDPQGYMYIDVGNGWTVPLADTFDQLENTVNGKVNTSSIQSTVTSGNTNPVNSVAVIAYINSLDATNTLY